MFLRIETLNDSTEALCTAPGQGREEQGFGPFRMPEVFRTSCLCKGISREASLIAVGVEQSNHPQVRRL